MNKSQALNQFWNSFGIPAYDENSVPEKVQNARGVMTPLKFPYITYSEALDSLGNVVPLSASIWDRSTSWEFVMKKQDEIAKKLGEYGHYTIKLDDGYVYLCKGTPFAQRMSDSGDVRRVYINVLAEFLTRY